MARAFTFPGQGSQAVGMGKELAEAFAPAREVFEEVNDALGQNLTKLMWEGPEDELTLTENAQPALMAVSLAAMRTLEREGSFALADKAAFVAGHSLGEYSALAAAGTFTVADTARLLKLRGRAMQRAVPVGEGAMAAMLGLDFDVAKEVAEEAAQGDVCQAANDNAPGQVVISGAKAAVERAAEIAKTKGAKRAHRGSNAGAFRAACRQCDGIAGRRRRNHPQPAGGAGDGHGALARKCPLYGGSGRDPAGGSRRGQGADRHGKTHRQGSGNRGCRHACRC